MGGDVDTHFFAHRRADRRGPRPAPSTHRRLASPGPRTVAWPRPSVGRRDQAWRQSTGLAPDLRVMHNMVAVGLQPCSHVLRRPSSGSCAVDADREDVIGHGVSQHGSGVHRTNSAVSSASCRPGLRPYVIPAAGNSDRGVQVDFRRHRLLKLCDNHRTTDGHPRLAITQGYGSPVRRFDARRNDNGGGLAESWAVPCRRRSGQPELGSRPAVVRDRAGCPTSFLTRPRRAPRATP